MGRSEAGVARRLASARSGGAGERFGSLDLRRRRAHARPAVHRDADERSGRHAGRRRSSDDRAERRRPFRRDGRAAAGRGLSLRACSFGPRRTDPGGRRRRVDRRAGRSAPGAVDRGPTATRSPLPAIAIGAGADVGGDGDRGRRPAPGRPASARRGAVRPGAVRRARHDRCRAGTLEPGAGRRPHRGPFAADDGKHQRRTARGSRGGRRDGGGASIGAVQRRSAAGLRDRSRRAIRSGRGDARHRGRHAVRHVAAHRRRDANRRRRSPNLALAGLGRGRRRRRASTVLAGGRSVGRRVARGDPGAASRTDDDRSRRRRDGRCGRFGGDGGPDRGAGRHALAAARAGRFGDDRGLAARSV
ncbi:hypothetical protein LzC2_37200 [Planctomycetes bacterium LzC2]|uniref:LigA n=1 Tax=Alienimonas chondri TaxID=2681879 RepID=A0ABX1VHL0_9PLAN|nr:hypothetical protein [Alienimonas chondri]